MKCQKQSKTTIQQMAFQKTTSSEKLQMFPQEPYFSLETTNFRLLVDNKIIFQSFWSYSVDFYLILILKVLRISYNLKIWKKMSTLSIHNSDIKFVTYKSKLSNFNHSKKTSPISPLTKFLPQRNAIIDWIYRAQNALSFSRSSLFLAIALLDKLLIKGLPLNDSNCELIGGTLCLLITKFNEVYPVTVIKLHALSNHSISLEKYVEIQSYFLEALEFDLLPQNPIYQNLAKLDFKLGSNSFQIIHIVVTNPAVAFKLNEEALFDAIQSMTNGGLMERKNESRLSRQSLVLRTKLQRLCSHSPNNNRLERMVSPTRF